METITPNMEESKYRRAQKRVKELKDFYSHVRTYIVINILIILLRSKLISMINGNVDNKEFLDWIDWNILIMPAMWGIGLMVHGIYVHRDRFKFFKSWEEHKIRELMDKDKETYRNNRWE